MVNMYDLPLALPFSNNHRTPFGEQIQMDETLNVPVIVILNRYYNYKLEMRD